MAVHLLVPCLGILDDLFQPLCLTVTPHLVNPLAFLNPSVVIFRLELVPRMLSFSVARSMTVAPLASVRFQ